MASTREMDERGPSQPALARYAEVPPASRLNADRHGREDAARPCCRLQSGPIAFDPALWLGALTSIGGGYALMSGRRLAFLVDECRADELTGVMAQIVGQPDRQEAVKHAIERRQVGEA